MTLSTATDMCQMPVPIGLSNRPQELLAAWNATVHGVFAHSATTGPALTQTLELAPTWSTAEALRGLSAMLLGRRELRAPAQEALDTARRHLGEAEGDPRAATFTDVLEDYLAGQLKRATGRLDSYLAQHPQDALAVKLCHAIRFVRGDAKGMRRSLEDTRHAIDTNHPAHGYIEGCYAFALEETQDYSAAERVGIDAMAFTDDDAWGLHALSHVYDMTNNVEAGVRWIESETPRWAHCNNFRYHISWHLALFHLERGDHARVLDLYDREVRIDRTDDYRDISNGASLLLRLEFDGVNTGGRWEEMAALCEKRTHDQSLPFADLHYMMALMGGGRKGAMETLLDNMRRAARDELRADIGKVFEHPGMALANGLDAFSSGRYGTAYLNLDAGMEALPGIGGSFAQRDIFERCRIEAALRAGLYTEARKAVLERNDRRGAMDGFARTRLDMIDTMIDRVSKTLQREPSLTA